MANQKNVMGIGVDTLSPDISEPFNVHKSILSKDKYIVENISFYAN